MTDNAVSLIDRNLGHPPPFRKGLRDCDDGSTDGARAIYYSVFYCVARVLLRMKQYLTKQYIFIISVANYL